MTGMVDRTPDEELDLPRTQAARQDAGGLRLAASAGRVSLNVMRCILAGAAVYMVIAHVVMPMARAARDMPGAASDPAARGLLAETTDLAATGSGGIADHDPARIDAASRIALERIGYIPRGGQVSPEEEFPAARTRRFESSEITVPEPGVLSGPEGEIRIKGITAPDANDACFGAFDSPFPCRDWSAEGLRVLLDHASDMRCLIDGSHGDAAYREAICSVNIGGDWIDIADWAVRNGVALADGAGALREVQEQARQARHGIWSAVWQPEGAPRIDFSPATSFELVSGEDDLF